MDSLCLFYNLIFAHVTSCSGKTIELDDVTFRQCVNLTTFNSEKTRAGHRVIRPAQTALPDPNRTRVGGFANTLGRRSI
ncbi:hypothetical protein ACSBR1_043119 [Camellia fascicularis]